MPNEEQTLERNTPAISGPGGGGVESLGPVLRAANVGELASCLSGRVARCPCRARWKRPLLGVLQGRS